MHAYTTTYIHTYHVFLLFFCTYPPPNVEVRAVVMIQNQHFSRRGALFSLRVLSVCMFVYVCMYVCVHACIHICIYIYIYTYIHTHQIDPDRQTQWHLQTDRRTDRQIDRQVRTDNGQTGHLRTDTGTFFDRRPTFDCQKQPSQYV